MPTQKPPPPPRSSAPVPPPKQSLWQRYSSLTPRTRLLIGGGLMAYATFATYATDTAEKALGFEATEKDKEELKKWVPKISVVDKVER